MHPSRLALLASRHAPKRKIVDREHTSKGWNLKLDCGHTGHCVSHATPQDTWSCKHCGEKEVRSAPQYAKEFSKLNEGYWKYTTHPKTGKRIKVRVESDPKRDPQRDKEALNNKRRKFVNEDTKFPALKGKTKQDFTGEVDNAPVKNNTPFGKKLRAISPKREKSGLKGDLVNPNSDGDWQKSDGMDRTISMQNIQKFDQHIGNGNTHDAPFVVKVKSGKDGRMLAPDVGFKNAPEHIKRMKGVSESREADCDAKKKDEEIKDLADELEDHEDEELKKESKEEIVSEILESYFEDKWAAIESIEEKFLGPNTQSNDNSEGAWTGDSAQKPKKPVEKFDALKFRKKNFTGIQKEEVELDEISRATLSRYIKKAPAKEFGHFPRKGEKDRSKGVTLALRKKWGDKEYGTQEPRVKANEEVEHLEELSPETLDSYRGKAFISQHRGGDKSKPFSDKDQQTYRKRQKGIQMARSKMQREEVEVDEASFRGPEHQNRWLHGAEGKDEKAAREKKEKTARSRRKRGMALYRNIDGSKKGKK